MAVETTKKLAGDFLKIPEFVAGIINEVARPALKEAVAKTATPLDDMAEAALAPIIAEYINKELSRLYYQELLKPAAE